MTSTLDPSLVVDDLVKHSLRPTSRPGHGVISLASGDPDFPTPPHITEALCDAVLNGHTHYAQFQGDSELRALIADRVSEKSGRTFEAIDVVVTHGGSAAVAASVLATINPGDRVVIPEPTYSLYSDLIRLARATPVFVRHRPDFHLDIDAIAAAAPGSRMIVLCNPCNPTGAVYDRDELEAVAAIALRNDLFVMVDEAYDHIVYDGVDFVSSLEIEHLADRLIYVQTLSKTFAMTGWRVGYLAAPRKISEAAALIHRTLNGPLNTAVQRAAIAALGVSSEEPERMRREYQTRRELVLELLYGIPGVELRPPDGTFYAFVHYPQDVSSMEMVSEALNHGVAVRPGSEFGPGGEGFIRIAFSTERELLAEGVRRLRSSFATSKV